MAGGTTPPFVRIRVEQNNVVINDKNYNAGDEVVITGAIYDDLSDLLDDGVVTFVSAASSDGDTVFQQGYSVEADDVMSQQASGETPTKAEFDLLLADVSNISQTLKDLIGSLSGVGLAIEPTEEGGGDN